MTARVRAAHGWARRAGGVFRGVAGLALARVALAGVALTGVLACAGTTPEAPDPEPAGPEAAGLPDRRSRVYEPSEVEQAPELIACGDWIDHGEARLSYAVVQFTITATGVVQEPRVIEAPARIPEVSVEALGVARSCRFRPARRGGEAVAVRWSKRFDFTDIG